MSGCGKRIQKGDNSGFRCGEPYSIQFAGEPIIRRLCYGCGGDYDLVERPATVAEPQPTEKKNGRVVIIELIADLEARSKIGQTKYGQRLRSFNGRNALMDAYQEVLDLAMYLKQKLIEEEELNADRSPI